MNGNIRLIGILVLGTLVLAMVCVQMVGAETAHVANHVVISEFVTKGSSGATDEFVELYNPANSAIDISDWKLQYKSATGTTWSSKTGDGLPAGTTIAAHGFYLLASKGYVGTVTPDYQHNANWGLADAGGHVRIIDSTPSVIDLVGWGTANSAEGGNPAPSQEEASYSVERKAIASSDSTKMALGGDHYTWGNGEDTNNNGNDFVRQTNGREPQNSSSDTEDCPAQSWFLSNVTDGGDYIMYKENMSKPEDTVAVSDGSSTVWKANEPATVDVGFPGGTWTGTITLDTAFSNNFTVKVGSWNGSAFSSAGSKLINGDGSITYSLSISASAFTVQETEYLALQMSPSGADLNVKIGDGNSYVISPETDPGYPVPELSTLLLFSIGLIALAGYVLLTKRRQ